MKFNWRRITTTLGLIGCLMSLTPACVVAVRGQASARPVYVVDEAPPPPRYQTPAPRPGYVWVRGHWQFYAGRGWVWQEGRWERERANYRWEPGHWERRGGRHHWVEGRWVPAGGRVIVSRPEPQPAPVITRPAPAPAPVVTRPVPHRPPHAGVPAPAAPPSQYPTTAPPPPRPESPGAARAGYVFVPGRWEWKGGQYQWVSGHWERARAAMVWESGRWELRGNYYVWIEGGWVKKAPGSPKFQDNRRPR